MEKRQSPQNATQTLVGVWLTDELLQKLHRMAANTQRTRSDMLRHLIAKEPEQMTLEATP